MTVCQFIRRWFERPAVGRHAGWRSTPDRIGCSGTARRPSREPAPEETEILAIRLPGGRVIANSSVLSIARGEPQAFGQARSGPEAPAQRTCIDLGALPVPFSALREAGVPLPTGFDDPLPPDFRIADWKGPETVEIDHRHRQGERCELCREWASRSSSRKEERHYTGAALIVQSAKQFLFDLDRGELCRGRWNPFVCLLQGGVEAKNVEEAYDSLMPTEVRAAKTAGLDVKRQGEWFFIPAPAFVPPELPRDLLETVKSKPHALGYGILAEDTDWGGAIHSRVERTPAVRRFEADLKAWEEKAERVRGLLPGSKALQVEGSRGHTATQAIELGEGVIYATGIVRAPDHDDLVLGGWHRVFMNTAARSFRVSGDID